MHRLQAQPEVLSHCSRNGLQSLKTFMQQQGGPQSQASSSKRRNSIVGADSASSLEAAAGAEPPSNGGSDFSSRAAVHKPSEAQVKVLALLAEASAATPKRPLQGHYLKRKRK